MILLPLAELHDLEIFLRGGHEPQADTRDLEKIYDFDKEFPELGDPAVLHQALLKELYEIASALLWLHSELRIFDSPDRYLAHMDLKPDNILLGKADKMPAGQWMLSDFGVSLFEKSTNKKATTLHAIRDVGPRLTSRANRSNVMRGHGPYEPPEVNLETVDGRKCDVWSFGCILCDLLAFALGGTKAVAEFRGLRYDHEDDKFYRAQHSLTDRTKVINNSNTALKPGVVTWLSERKTAQPWVADYVAVVLKALVPDPSARQGIREIMEDLSKLSRKMSTGTTSLGIDSSLPLRGPSFTISEPPGITPSHNFKAKGTNESSSSGGSSSQPHKTYSSKSTSPPVSAPGQVRTPETTDPPSRLVSSPEEADKQTTGSTRSDPSHIVDSTSHATPISQSSQLERSLSFGASSAAQYQPWGYKINLNIPRRKKVIALALAPSVNKVAFLFKDSARVFSTSSESAGYEDIDLPSNVDWRKISFASHYLAMYGIAPSHEKRVSGIMCHLLLIFDNS